jgi:RNA polymerase sigma factor (sigma-70 family)
MAQHPSSPETRLSFIQRVTELDPASWAEFIKLYDSLLQAFVGDCNKRYQFNLGADDREDIKQEILIKLFYELSSFDMLRRFRTWLWRVSHNVVIDWMRQHRGRRKLTKDEREARDPLTAEPRMLKVPLTQEMADALPDGGDPPDEQLIQDHLWQMRRHILERAKDEMQSSRKWDCFEKHFLQGNASTEVAKELGLTVTAVNTNTSRVRARIRALCQYYDVEL